MDPNKPLTIVASDLQKLQLDHVLGFSFMFFIFLIGTLFSDLSF